jgi:hypothetical protein
MSCTVIRSEEGGITILEILENFGRGHRKPMLIFRGPTAIFAKWTGRKCIGALFDNVHLDFDPHEWNDTIVDGSIVPFQLAANVLEATGWFQHVV